MNERPTGMVYRPTRTILLTKILFIMTKKEFRELLLANGIYQVSIIRVPDYNSGWSMMVLFNRRSETYVLDDFEYIEYQGGASEVVRDMHKIFLEHYEPRYQDPIDYEYPLWNLVEIALR